MKTKAGSVLCMMALMGCGAPLQAEDSTVEASKEVVPESAQPGSVQEMHVEPPANPGCTSSDEYYYETTTYAYQNAGNLWRCSGFDAFGNAVECQVYQVCQVAKVWANSALCSDGALYTYRWLKSTTTNNCFATSYDIATGATCPVPLYAGYCD